MYIICTICTELLTENELENMYITQCGHLFHLQCMLRWINRSPCCPQCRERVTKKLMIRVYPTLSEEPEHSPEFLQRLISQEKEQAALIEKQNGDIAALLMDISQRAGHVYCLERKIDSMKYRYETKISKLQTDLDLQKTLTDKLRRKNDKYLCRHLGMDIKMKKKVTDVKNKYRYHAKRNIEWRKAAYKKHHELYLNTIDVKEEEERSSVSSCSESLSETDSPVSTDSSDSESSDSDSLSD